MLFLAPEDFACAMSSTQLKEDMVCSDTCKEKILAAILAIGVAFQSYTFSNECSLEDNGLVGWFRAEGNGTNSVSGGASGVSQEITYAQGKVGSAFELNGHGSHLIVADSARYAFSNAMAIEVWVFPKAIAGNYREIASRWDTGDYSYTLTLRPSGEAAFNICSDGWGAVVSADTESRLPLNTWTHLAVSYDGAKIQMFINGVLETEVEWQHGVWPGSSRLVIGSTSSAPSFFQGLLDELTFYNRPLNAGEVRAIYEAGPLGKCGLHEKLQVAADSRIIAGAQFTARGGTTLTVLTANPGYLFYTLNGKDPKISGLLYSAPFKVTESSLLRLALFAPDLALLAERSLELKVVPALSSQTDGGGIINVDPSSGAYLQGDLVHLTATASPGWQFLHWLGDIPNENDDVFLKMDAEKQVEAVFGTPLTSNVVGAGVVVRDQDLPLYAYGTKVRLTAVPSPGNYFAFWGNAGAGSTNNPFVISITASNPLITAVFASLGSSKTNSLALIAQGNGTVQLTPTGTRFPTGTAVTLVAIPDPGQEFLGWKDLLGNEKTLRFNLDTNRVVTAVFSQMPSLNTRRYAAGPTNELVVRVSGAARRAYSILTSTNLTNWHNSSDLSNVWGKVEARMPIDTREPARFIRVKER